MKIARRHFDCFRIIYGILFMELTNPRHFPPPWIVEDLGASFVVMDSSGQKIGYFYYEEEPGQKSTAKLQN